MNIETVRMRYEPASWDGVDQEKFRDAVLDFDNVVEVDGPHIDQGFYFEVSVKGTETFSALLAEWEQKLNKIYNKCQER